MSFQLPLKPGHLNLVRIGNIIMSPPVWYAYQKESPMKLSGVHRAHIQPLDSLRISIRLSPRLPPVVDSKWWSLSLIQDAADDQWYLAGCRLDHVQSPTPDHLFQLMQTCIQVSCSDIIDLGLSAVSGVGQFQITREGVIRLTTLKGPEWLRAYFTERSAPAVLHTSGTNALCPPGACLLLVQL